MRYQSIKKAIFLARPNRFIAHVMLEGGPVVCHVKNTGRCRELLVPGATVYLEHSSNPNRKTAYDLIAVEKGALLVNIDSQAPNHIFAEWAQDGRFHPELTSLRPEVTYGRSRFDFHWTSATASGFVEVKGCTLEEEGIVRFPDAPTLRGVKHMEELISARAAGYQAAVCFVIQVEHMFYFEPNDATHPEFGAALRRAQQAGVELIALGCRVSQEALVPDRTIPIRL